jgi:hypothetical protein
VLVVAASVALGLIQILRFWTFVQMFSVSIFYWFGANTLYKMLIPTRGPNDGDDAYKKMCEPAEAIKKCGHNSCGFAIAYLLVSAAASGPLSSMDQNEGKKGGFLFLGGLFMAGGM